MLRVLFIFLFLAGCSTTTVRMQGQEKSNRDPFYQNSQAFFVAGVGQKRSLDLQAICGTGRQVTQIQMQNDIIDTVFAFISSGIYWPRTVRVWCKPSGLVPLAKGAP